MGRLLPATRRWCIVGAVTVLVTLGGGCASAQPPEQIQFAIGDLGLRAVGAECAGLDSLNFLHAGAAFRVTDDGGSTVARGALPAGVARPALDTDFGNAVRVPTVCAMDIAIPARSDGNAKWLVVPPGKPISLVTTPGKPGWSAQIPEAPAPARATASAAAPATGQDAGAGATSDGESDPGAAPAVNSAPDFTGRTIDGGTVTSSDLWARQPAVLVFFTSWCQTCGQQQAALTGLARKYDGRVTFLGISADQDAGKLQRYLVDHPVGYQVVSDPQRLIWQAYAVPEPLFVVLIDEGGTLARGWPQVSEEDLRSALEAVVKQ